VRHLAARWAAELTDDALLLTSELLTNAVRYGGGGVTLSVTADTATVRIAVSDDNPRRPTLPSGSPAELRSGGRGLLILQALACR
jgi:anti-sigma regulatory factor (Ser/Thr protein kinase)